MKIVYLITRLDEIGGAQQHVRALAKAQKELGNQVAVVAGGEAPFISGFEEAEIDVLLVKPLVREIKPINDFRAFFQVRKMLKNLQPDMISIHSTKAGIIGRLAARSMHIPALFTAHGWVFSGGITRRQQKEYLLIERLAARLSSKIITVSEYDRRLALGKNMISPEKIVTVHNGVADIPEDLRSRPGKDPVTMIMVARLGTPKDHGLLLEALSSLTQHDWCLQLVGEGPLRAELEDSVAKLKLQERVFFLGARQDTAELLSQSQISLLISRKEGLPRVILESMRAGLPVIASDVGGVSETIDDGRTGYLVPESDSSILKERIARLLLAPDLREQMGHEGRRRYEEYFTLDRMIAETTRVYRDLLPAPSEHLPDRAHKDRNIQGNSPA
jgi:glycosyltransferase involved in cell wall biosynthesis